MTVLCVHCLTNASNAPQNYFPETPLGSCLANLFIRCMHWAVSTERTQMCNRQTSCKASAGEGIVSRHGPPYWRTNGQLLRAWEGEGAHAATPAAAGQDVNVRLEVRPREHSPRPGTDSGPGDRVAISRSPEQDEGSPWPRHGPMFSPAVANNVFLTLAAECNGR